MSRLIVAGARARDRGVVVPPPSAGTALGWTLTNLGTAPATPPDVTDRYVATNEVGLAGFPAGVIPPLQRVTGTYTTTHAGQVIFGMDLDNLVFAHANCIAVGNKIRGRIDGRIDCHVWGNDWGREAPGDTNLNGMRFALGSIKRNNIFGFTDLGQINNTSGVTMMIRDNALHDNSVVSDSGQSGGISHNDVYQIVNGGNVSVIHNTVHAWSFYARGGETCTALGPGPHWGDESRDGSFAHGYQTSFMLINNGIGAHDIRIEDNWVDGHVAAFIHVAYPTFDVTNIVIKGNKFGRAYKNGPTGPCISGPKGTAWTDEGVPNVYMDTGLPIAA